MPVLLYDAETWNVSKHDLQKLKTFLMPLRRPQCHPVGQNVKHYHPGGNWGATNSRLCDREGCSSLGIFRGCQPIVPEATCAMQTE